MVLPGCLSMLVLAMLVSLPSHAGGKEETHTYQGAWFTIRYPRGFQVRNGQKGQTSMSGYDSAYFRSPDGAVEFYVFSPQWSGNPDYVHVDPRREIVVAQKTKQAGKRGFQIKTTWMTVQARDKSYSRSWVDTRTDDTRLVFGIRYRDGQALTAYRRQYTAFKKSLQQFAD